MDITYQSVALILKCLKDSENQAAVDAVELHDVPKDMELVDALIHKKDDRVRKELEKRIIIVKKAKSLAIKREAFRFSAKSLHLSCKAQNKLSKPIFMVCCCCY